MAIVEAIKTAKNAPRKLRISNPATLEEIGVITVTDAEATKAAVRRAREAQREWAQRPIKERCRLMYRALDVLMKNQDEYMELIIKETGRGRAETLMMEILAAADTMAWFAKRGPKELADRRVATPTILKAKKLIQTYKPLGVVGIIAPWNGPFVMGISPAIPALIAGNAVVIKPSEVTPFSGMLIQDLFAEAGFPNDLLQVLPGDGETGAALIDAGVNKISFTGSTATGRKVAAACGQNLIPCTLELGGKDAMIVCADANLERAAAGALAASMFNTGQFCCATERCYVVESVAEEFISLVVEKARELRQGTDGDQDISVMIWPKQLEIIQDHMDDAVQKGATVLVGGRQHPDLNGAWEPTVLTNVTHSMKIMTEESFGPILPIMIVPDQHAAVQLANDSKYGLSGTVWSRSEKNAIAVAKQVETGSVCINETALTFGVHNAPFGGVKDSGMGYVHGPDALKSFCQPVPLIVDRLGMKTEQNWYPLTADKFEGMQKFVKVFYGSVLRKVFG